MNKYLVIYQTRRCGVKDGIVECKNMESVYIGALVEFKDATEIVGCQRIYNNGKMGNQKLF